MRLFSLVQRAINCPCVLKYTYGHDLYNGTSCFFKIVITGQQDGVTKGTTWSKVQQFPLNNMLLYFEHALLLGELTPLEIKFVKRSDNSN